MKLFLASDFSPDVFPKIAAHLGDLAGKRVLLITTAAHGEGFEPDEAETVIPFTSQGAQAERYDLANRDAAEITAKMQQADIISISGGNTFYLLEHLNTCGFRGMLRAAWMAHKTYIGSSAGSIVMGRDIGFMTPMDDPSRAQNLTDYTGMGLIDALILPHHKSPSMPALADAATQIMAQHKGDTQMIALEDHQVLYIPDANKKLMLVL